MPFAVYLYGGARSTHAIGCMQIADFLDAASHVNCWIQHAFIIFEKYQADQLILAVPYRYLQEFKHLSLFVKIRQQHPNFVKKIL